MKTPLLLSGGLAVILAAGQPVAPPAPFGYPDGVAVDAAGYVYVVDSDNSTVQKVSPTGDLAPLAIAGLSYPTGVAVDATTGTVYVADAGTHSIMQVSPTGEVSKMAHSRGLI